MKTTINFILIALFILAQYGCSNINLDEKIASESIEELELKAPLKELSFILESIDSSKIKNITTEQGYSSLMLWSDTLNDTSFLNRLTKDLKYCNIAEINKWNDSMIAISLGELDEIVGATHGNIVLKKINKELKIDEFRGVK